MRIVVVVVLLAFSAEVQAQPEGQVQLPVPTVHPADADLVDQVRRRSHRRRGAAQRCVEEHSADRAGRVELYVALRYGSEARFAGSTVEERGEVIDDALARCLLRAFATSFRTLVLSANTRVSIPVTYVLPPPTPSPTATELADAALEKANAARAFGRCYLNAGNQMRAAARALRSARGQARVRALVRIERARAALGLCQLTGSIGSAVSGVTVPSCPGCLSVQPGGTTASPSSTERPREEP